MEGPQESFTLSLDMLGEPGKLMEKVAGSRLNVELAMQEGITFQDGPDYVRSAMNAHGLILRGALQDIFTGEETDTEKGTLASIILVDDDAKRVDFLKEFTDGRKSTIFRYGYSAPELFSASMIEALGEAREEEMPTDNFVEMIMDTHDGLMESDVQALFKTRFALVRLNEAEQLRIKKQQNGDKREKLKFLAYSAAATAIGSLASKAIWEVITRRRDS